MTEEEKNIKNRKLMDELYNSYSRFDKSNQIHHTAIIYDNVVMGKNNIIGPYTVIGSNGEIRNCKEFKGCVEIGDNNTISELVTIQRPASDTVTKIGNNNLIMAHSHIGHDVIIGNDCEICSGSILGGYVKVDDGVKIKLGCTIRNRIVLGKKSLIGLGSAVVKNIDANTIVYGNPAKPH